MKTSNAHLMEGNDWGVHQSTIHPTYWVAFLLNLLLFFLVKFGLHILINCLISMLTVACCAPLLKRGGLFSIQGSLNNRGPGREASSPALAVGPASRPHFRRKTVFISYRRESGDQLARLVQSELERRSYKTFLDVDDLGPNYFDSRLIREIRYASNFVVVLSPGCLTRCRQQDDWLRREISLALRHRKNIVPLVMDNFEFPSAAEIPEDIKGLIRHNSVVYSHHYFQATFDRLESYLIK